MDKCQEASNQFLITDGNPPIGFDFLKETFYATAFLILPPVNLPRILCVGLRGNTIRCP